MSLVTALRRRALLRGLAVGAVVASAGLLGVPAASAAEEERVVVPLDPPDVGVLLLPQENEELGWLVEEDSPAAAAMASAAELVPPEVVSALGAQADPSTRSHATRGAVDVGHGGTLVVTLPELIDAGEARFTLDLEPPHEEDPPRSFHSDAELPEDVLDVDPLPGNQYSITLPAAVPEYGPLAILTADGLGTTRPGTEVAIPLFYVLEFSETAPAAVTVEPTLGLVAHATCSLLVEEACPGPTVESGALVDLVVPPSSMLTDLGYGRLDSAVVVLESFAEGEGEGEGYATYDSVTDPGLLTVHGPSAATVRVPDGVPAGPLDGMVVEGEPATGFAVTFFSLEVPKSVAGPEPAANPGLRSDTGWVDEVREVSPGSTAAVAGGALLLVGGLLAVAAVLPGRRPPLGG